MKFIFAALFAAFAACSLAQPATDITPNPSLATDGTNPSLATDGTNPSLATDGTNPTPATDRPTITPLTCDISWATYCLKTYIDRFGFNSATTGVFPDPGTFNQAAGDYINANGVNGLVNTHTWWLALQTCLGPNSFPCLFDPDALQRIFNTDATTMDATIWLITFLEEDYAHGEPAYTVIRTNFHCAQQVQVHYNDSITRCQDTYVSDVQKDPSNVCSYQVFFMTCMQTIFASNCGNKLGGYVCNEVGIVLRVLNPQCLNNPPSNNFCYSLT